MKLSRHAFTRFWDVHAWVGVVGGVVLHVMFFAGAFSLFHAELNDWQEGTGESPTRASASISPILADALGTSHARPDRINIWLPGANRRVVEISWQESSGERVERRFDAASGAPAPTTSRLGTILYWLHFLYHPKVPWGMYVAGALGVAMLVAIMTGVLIHLKDLVRQFHQFRPTKTTKVLWSDMHKVLGVMGLPFQLMYALTGSLLCFVSVALSLFVGPVFEGDGEAASASLWGEPPKTQPSGHPAAPMLDIDQLLDRARAAVPGFRPEYVRLEAIGDAAATASFWGEQSGRLFGRGDVVLRAADGALLADTVSAFATPGAATTRWVTGLHYGWFGGLAAKTLYALLAAATCLTILSGNWIWLARRQARATRTSYVMLSRLTIGVGGGVLVATAALFGANRLAPAPVRATCEAWAFFGVWAACALLFLLRAESREGWTGLLRAAGAGFAAVPIASAAGRGSRGIAGVEIGLLLVGAALWGVAAIVKRRGRLASWSTRILGDRAQQGEKEACNENRMR